MWERYHIQIRLLTFYNWPEVSHKTTSVNNDSNKIYAFVENWWIPRDKILTDKVQVIGCYNKNTWKTREVTSKWNCYHWDGWRFNIMLPPLNHISIRKEFYTDHQIVNRLWIVNFESSFDENASNHYAHWYVQTLKSHWITPDIRSQLERMRNREHHSVLPEYIWSSPRCWVYWKKDNTRDGFPKWEAWVLSCMYRYHYDANKWSWYARRVMAAREYYIQWFESRFIDVN